MYGSGCTPNAGAKSDHTSPWKHDGLQQLTFSSRLDDPAHVRLSLKLYLYRTNPADMDGSMCDIRTGFTLTGTYDRCVVQPFDQPCAALLGYSGVIVLPVCS
jgi:hypothetical protein